MDFFTFYNERCKAHNQAFGAPPGVHLPEAGALALNDFLGLLAVATDSQANGNQQLNNGSFIMNKNEFLTDKKLESN